MAKLVGTAGHVDHGKTSLIRGLTGIDADRLPEEKRRGLTIDLGFAFLDLPQSGRVSFVDVPGHEKFVTNMLVGAMAMDVVLLCIAADVGVMPQTREHFEILCLLPIEKLIVVLTRCDTTDEVTLELVKEEISELLAKSRFENSEVLETSAITGAGIERLKNTLDQCLNLLPERNIDTWFLPIDRVFVQPGHGTVVTGSLQGGPILLESQVRIWPGDRKARLRSIQVHGEPRIRAEIGQRVALNLGGVSADEIERGDLLTSAGDGHSSSIFDAEINWIRPGGHGKRVRVSVGADEVIGKVFLNDHSESLVQLRLEREVGLRKGMPVIVRQYSPSIVLGGGVVTNPITEIRRKSEKMDSGSVDSLLACLTEVGSALETGQLARRVGWEDRKLSYELEQAKASGELLSFAGLWMTPQSFEFYANRIESALAKLHQKFQEKSLLPKEGVFMEAEIVWRGKIMDRLISKMVEDGSLRSNGHSIALIDYRPELKDKQRILLDKVVEILDASSPNVSAPHELAGEIHVPVQAIENILVVGIEAGELIKLDENVFFTPQSLEKLVVEVRDKFSGVKFGAAEFRDALGTTRKFAIPILEWMDLKGITVRQGENRVVVGSHSHSIK